MSNIGMRNFKKLIPLLTYLFAALAVFGPFLDNPFLMDDELQITGNSAIQNLQNWKSFFFSSTMDSGGMKAMGGIYYKPLMTLYYSLTWWFAGPDPASFRLPLLLLHVASGFMIYRFLHRIFETHFQSSAMSLAAFFAGLIFVLHPANVEIVAYVADAQDALYLFFGLIALETCTLKSGLRYPTTAFFMMAAILSKETGALFCIAIPIYVGLDLPNKRQAAKPDDQSGQNLEKNQGAKKSTSALMMCGVSLMVFAGYAILRWSAGLTSYHHSTLLLQQASWLTRLQTVPLILWHYIEIFIFPWRISMVTDFVVSDIGLQNFWLPLFGDLIALSFSAYVVKSVSRDRKRGIAILAVSWLALWFGLHGNALLPLDGTYADRWLYFAFLPLLTLLLLAMPAVWWERRVLPAGLTLLTIGFMVRDHLRLRDWSHPMDLYTREHELHPRDAVMNNNVGVEIFKKGEALGSRRYFKEATEINPIWDVAWNNLGATFQRTGDLNLAEEAYAKAVTLGSYSLAFENYAGLICSRASVSLPANPSALENCFVFLSKAVTIFPENPRLRDIESYYRNLTTH